jgi:RHS repeat-associated protein
MASTQSSNFCWAYDSFGNRTSQIQSNQTISGDGTYCSPQSPSSAAWIGKNTVYTASNQIDHDVDPVALTSLGTPVQYDTTYGSGNVIADGQNGGTPHSYLYDADGRICAVRTPSGIPSVNLMIQYLYDAEGNRIGKGTITQWSCDLDLSPNGNGFQLTNEYVLGRGGEQVTEFATADVTPANPDGWAHTNAYAGGQLIATFDMAGGSTYSNPALHYQLTDWLGTRRLQVSPSGAIEETCQSLPFGDQLDCLQNSSISTSDDGTEHHFTGKERDPESGNDYFGARYYASSIGRWTTPDPSGLFFADPTNPQSLNLYGYVNNNPANSIDTGGLLTIVIPGTFWKAESWSYQNPLVGEATAHFHEQHKTWIDLWDPRGDKDEDREAAAKGLREFINNYHFAPGETLNIVAHSHGGNIALLAAALGLKHRIDSLITLGTPFGYASMSSGVGQWYNVTGRGDDVQPDFSKGCWNTISCANQKGAHNMTVDSGGHSTLWSDSDVRMAWWNWYVNQQREQQQQQPSGGDFPPALPTATRWPF